MEIVISKKVLFGSQHQSLSGGKFEDTELNDDHKLGTDTHLAALLPL